MGERFDRGHVVWHDGLFRGSGRPWLVVSDDTYAFHGEEYLVVGITTTERSQTVAIDDDDLSVGGLPRQSYVSPWFLTTLKHAAIERGIGELRPAAISAVADEIDRYLP